MKLERDTPHEIATMVWLRAPTEPVTTVLAKATFTLADGETCRLVEEQPLVAGDVRHDDDDPDASPRSSIELVPFKPRGELIVAGTCHPVGGAATVSAVAVRAGGLRKSLAVFGDRDWTLLSGPGKPRPFTSMPLRWERALGGPSYAANPYGMGIETVETESGTRRPMPNLELPDRLLTSRSDRPPPAGFFPLLASHPERAGRAQPVARDHVRTRWPAVPEAFDFERFCAAPRDQRIDGWWRGDEEIVLTNLRPDCAVLTAKLSGARPRVFLERAKGATELAMRLDTIFVDADAVTVSLLWRGVAVVADARASDVARVLVAEEPAGRSPRAMDDVMAAVRAHTRAERDRDAMEDTGLLDGVGSRAESTEEIVDSRSDDASPRIAMDRETLIARRAASPTVDLSRVDLSRVDLTEIDLRGARLDGACLDGARLDGACLDGAALARASLVGASMRGVSLVRADLTGASLARADLEGATLADATLDGADLTEAKLARVVLDRADAIGTVMTKVTAIGASLRDTTLDEAKLAGAVLDDADVTRARLSDADLTGASLARVKASGAHFDGARMKGVSLGGADLTRADFRGADLERAVLAGSTMRRAMWMGASLRGADLRRVDLLDALLDGCDMRGADLRGASLFAAATHGTRLDDARLEGANLARTLIEARR